MAIACMTTDYRFQAPNPNSGSRPQNASFHVPTIHPTHSTPSSFSQFLQIRIQIMQYNIEISIIIKGIWNCIMISPF
ncbi:uncharacterized protein Bfra_009980 [Botrytis fragariae]|uniref:Uncharacterized protein n=1 Tax=Botrytis fragariae TaxID=1964551 RepID=A0A8H6ANE1_9HELO|nr:uncharacterized protein Bfra_009980 [Botrytis fragariae]KAF5870591.1 hypothetical protein Bfra_009980 [Botrytis fragariae]